MIIQFIHQVLDTLHSFILSDSSLDDFGDTWKVKDTPSRDVLMRHTHKVDPSITRN